MTSTINAKSTGVGGIDASGDASGVLALQTGGTTAVTIDASQNVGIGTTSPGTLGKLEVQGTSGNLGGLAIKNNATGNVLYGGSYTNLSMASEGAAFQITQVGGSGFLYGGAASVNFVQNSNAPMTFSTNSAERMRIDSSGNVGIGTTSASQKLTVNGDTYSVNYKVGNGNSVISTLDGYNNVIFYGSSGTGYTNSVGIYTNNSQRVLVDSSGNVGIGTNTPSSYGKLAVNGTISQIAAAGSYTIDTTGGATSIANGGTVDYANASGMLVVNNWTNGAVTIYLFGGGSTAAIGSVVGTVGTTAYNSGVAGYRWTNNSGSSGTFGFFYIRTRNTA